MTTLPADAAPARPRRIDLDLLRVVSIIGVVAIHVFAGAVSAAPQGSKNWWAAVVADIGFIWVVPVFVMLSGALVLAPKQYSQGPASFYRRRLVRLLPAVIFWPLVYIVVFRFVLAPTPAPLVDVFVSLADGRPYTHLYFLWLILGLYAVAPVLASFLHAGDERRALWMAGIVLAVTVAVMSTSSVLGYLGHARPLTLVAFTQWLPYTGFFLAGWALRNVVLRGARAWAVGIFTVLALVLVIAQYGFATHLAKLNAVLPVSYYGPVVAIVSLGVFLTGMALWHDWQPGSRVNAAIRALSDAAFGVFLVHFGVMLLLRRIPLFAEAPGSFAVTALQWALVVALSFGIALVARRIPGLRRVF